MVTFPNAKINIGLDILGKRADGYHDLSTVMVPVPLCDILEIIVGEGNHSVTNLNVTGNKVDCPVEKNLVYKAAELIRKECGFKDDLEIYLRKIIPDGAGMGGGSSDAAFTLKTINEVLELGLNAKQLEKMAAKLGADCAFFIQNRPALAQGIGEMLEPIELNELHGKKVLIVKPPESISTKEAYSMVHPEFPAEDLKVLIGKELTQWKNKIKNDFQDVIFSYHPGLKVITEKIYELGAIFACMTGSGSAFYGIFDSDADNLSAKASSIFEDKIKIYEGTLKF